MDQKESLIKIGVVELADNRQITWLVESEKEKFIKKSGEYHILDLPDGKFGLIRLVNVEAGEKGYRCNSLFLGAIDSTGLLPIDIPPPPGTPIYSATIHALRGAFWGDPDRDLQIASLTGTGDMIHLWLYLHLKSFNRHLGIFAQSGSGKSFAVGKIIEELFLKLTIWSKKSNKQAHIIILDPNGDFSNFSTFKAKNDILENIELIFRETMGFIPHLSWDYWIEDKFQKLKLDKHKTKEMLSSVNGLLIGWHLVDLQKDSTKRKAAQKLKEIENRIFNRKERIPTFIIIDEAHNYVPKDIPETSSLAKNLIKCQKIINRIAAEGRKYGAFLIVISQSPSKIHPDTLSQCSNIILMKITIRQDIQTLCELRTDIPSEFIERIARYGQGEALFLGKLVPAPVTGKIVGRISNEGGKDIEFK